MPTDAELLAAVEAVRKARMVAAEAQVEAEALERILNEMDFVVRERGAASRVARERLNRILDGETESPTALQEIATAIREYHRQSRLRQETWEQMDARREIASGPESEQAMGRLLELLAQE